MKQALYNGIIHTGDEILTNRVIIIENGVITAVADAIPAGAQPVNLQGDHISAGFIDIQVNGGEKHYFSQQPTEETIRDIYQSSLKYGTSHLLPCLISSPKDNILAAIETVKNYQAKYRDGVMGMHLEGPYLNPVKRGAHDLNFIRKPDDAELKEIIRYGKNIIKVITVAPECLTDTQIDMLLESGIVVSAGHSNMTYQQAQHYLSKGIKLVTHLFNAMNQLGHREPGLVGATLDNEQVYTPVVLDGAHCDYAAARIAYKVKKDKFFLISDAAFLGRDMKSFQWQGFDAHLTDGFYRNREGNLAGAAISMAEAVQNAVKFLNVTTDEAIKMATINAAKAIGVDALIGKIKPGYPASFARFSNDLQRIEALVL